MYGILIQYQYRGDETEWRAAIDAFIAAVNADIDLDGQFSYAVDTGADGVSRIHVGRWPDPETHALLQSRDYFKTFAPMVRKFGGDSLVAMQFENVCTTA